MQPSELAASARPFHRTSFVVHENAYAQKRPQERVSRVRRKIETRHVTDESAPIRTFRSSSSRMIMNDVCIYISCMCERGKQMKLDLRQPHVDQIAEPGRQGLCSRI